MTHYLLTNSNADGFYIVALTDSIEKAKALAHSHLTDSGNIPEADEMLKWRDLNVWEDGAKRLKTITAADYADGFGTFYIAELPLNKLA